MLPIVEELLHRGHRVSFVTTGASTERVIAVEAEATTGAARFPAAVTAASDAAAYAPTPPPSAVPTASIGTAARRLTDGPPDLLLYDAAVSTLARRLARRWELMAVRVCRSAVEEERGRGADRAARMSRILREIETPGGPPVRTGAVHVVAETEGAGPHGRLRTVEDPTLVLVPRAFQRSGDRFDDRYSFVGPCLDSRAHEETWYPPTPDRPVLLLAPGGLPAGRHVEFLRTCLAAVADQPWHVVITAAGDTDLTELRPLPPDVEIHREGPSAPAVLRYASAVVAPWGTRTAMESLYFGAPLVAVPGAARDQAVADRVEELGLGRTVPAGRMSAAGLRRATAEVMTDAGIRARVRRMRAHARAAGGTVGATNCIERYLDCRGRAATTAAEPAARVHRLWGRRAAD